MENRTIVFKSLVGSYNYNLNTEISDKDYKTFYYPTFDDLYSGDKNSKSTTSTIEDIEYHDIRKLPEMLYKSNVNFLEVLFSQEVKWIEDDLYHNLHAIRDDIARMNLPYLFDACMGMYHKKYKEFKRDIDTEKVYKHAMSGMRILDFLQRYEATDFSDFYSSIRYSDNDSMREFLLEVRNGQYNAYSLNKRLLEKEEYGINNIKVKYKAHKLNTETKETINEIVKEYVRETLRDELK